jgi:hypothetical protein
MAFYISTGASAVTLDDLGARVIAANTTNFDLEQEYPIETLRYSNSLADAIYSNGATCTDQLGRSITAQGSLALTYALLQMAFRVENTDHLPEGSTKLYYTDTRARAAISVAGGSSSFLSYDNLTGQISISSLALSQVTTDATYTSLSAWITGVNYSSGNKVVQNGDTLVLTAATGGTQVYLCTGNNAYTTADFVLIEAPANSVAVRALFSGSAPITYNSGTGAIGITQSTTSTDGYLSSTDWNTFNNKQNALTTGNVTSSDITVTGGSNAVIGSGISLSIVKGNLTETTSSVLTITGGSNSVLGSGLTIQVKQANTSTSGYLSSTDWNTFNNKQASGNYITSLTGEATASGPGAAAVTLTNSAVIGKVITGYTATTGTLAATDTILEAIQKLGYDKHVAVTIGTANGLSLSTQALSLALASTSTTGALSSTDWNTFNNKQGALTTGNLTETTSSILTITGGSGAIIGSGLTIQVKQANTSTSGYLSSTDWNTFNNKQAALTTGNLTSSDITVTGGTGAIIGSGASLAIVKGNLTEATSSVLTITGGTNSVLGSGLSIQVKQATTSVSGYLSSTDWNTFNNKQAALTTGNLTETTSSVLTITGGTGAIIGSGLTVQVKQATTSVSGYLSSTDWTTFNNKQATMSSGTGISIASNVISLNATMENLSNVTVTSVAANDVLVWSTGSSKWVNSQIPYRRSYTWSAGKSGNTNNAYINNAAGIASNTSPYVVFAAAWIRAISVRTSASATWTLAIYKNGASVATLAVTAATKAYSTGLSIALAAGDEISFFATTSGNVANITASVLIEEQ